MIIDTGVLFAAVNRRDSNYSACIALLRTEPGTLIVPALVAQPAPVPVSLRRTNRHHHRIDSQVLADSLDHPDRFDTSNPCP